MDAISNGHKMAAEALERMDAGSGDERCALRDTRARKFGNVPRLLGQHPPFRPQTSSSEPPSNSLSDS